MNFGPPSWVTKAAEEALRDVSSNHYSHPKGRPRLRQALSKFYDPRFNRKLDVETEILVSSGANEGSIPTKLCISKEILSNRISGQYAVFTAFLEEGDEVIMFEPFFDQYFPSVTFNAGTPVYVPLHPPKATSRKPTSNDWTIDFDELR